MSKPCCGLFFLLFFCLLFTAPVYSQETEKGLPTESVAEDVIVSESSEEPESKEKGQFHFFLNSNFIFALSASDGGFGLGETATFQYTLPFRLSFGIESGYYGFKSEVDNSGFPIIGGFSIIPIYGLVSYDFKILEGLYITPVLKGGFGYTTARINGWIGGESFSGMFEGGVRLKAFVGGGMLIQANVTYTGLIEKSGIFSILSLGFGFGI